jgi:hypothetical protein
VKCKHIWAVEFSLALREKAMRGLKKPETHAIIPGYQIYHNYVRPHEALDGKTRQTAAESKFKDRTSG